MIEASSEGAPARVRTIGKYVPLVDGPDKVSGRAHYTADLPAVGALAGRILRSPWGTRRSGPSTPPRRKPSPACGRW